MGIYDRDYYQEEAIQPIGRWNSRSAVSTIIVVNGALFLANLLLTGGNNAITDLLALKSAALKQPWEWWQFLSYGFTHSPVKITHILFNMASLYFLGRSVESRLGRGEFTCFYLVVIALCGLVWSGMHLGSNVPLVGASGGVTAVVMLFVFMYPQAELRWMMAVPIKAWMIGVLVLVSNLFSPMTSDGSVAYDVHLTGAGLAAAYHFGRFRFGSFASYWEQAKLNRKQKRSGLKVHDPTRDEASAKDEKESDRILDKIYREGEDSLTSKERKFMERYSREVRKKRER